MFLAKLHAWTRQPKVPPIQIYYVKYLAKSLVRPDRFHEPPVVTCGRYEWVIERCKDITILEAPANYTWFGSSPYSCTKVLHYYPSFTRALARKKQGISAKCPWYPIIGYGDNSFVSDGCLQATDIPSKPHAPVLQLLINHDVVFIGRAGNRSWLSKILHMQGVESGRWYSVSSFAPCHHTPRCCNGASFLRIKVSNHSRYSCTRTCPKAPLRISDTVLLQQYSHFCSNFYNFTKIKNSKKRKLRNCRVYLFINNFLRSCVTLWSY
jgi:hypothetical protein